MFNEDKNIHINQDIKHSIKQVTSVVVHNKEINSDYQHLILDAPKSVLDTQPGQFFQLLCPEVNGLRPYLRRPMSIYGVNKEKGELHFLYKAQGEGTNAMKTLAPGDNFSIVGPLGQGFNIAPSAKHLVLVARGVGLATLAPLADLAQKMGCRLTAICSARSPDMLMSTEYFESKGAEVITLTDSEKTSDITNLKNIMINIIKKQGVDSFYTCGSKRILKVLQQLSLEFNIPGEVALEQQMACGIGMCYCCVRPFRKEGKMVSERVCKEGPVFDLREVII